MSKNNRAWEKLFDKYNVLKHLENNDLFSISANQIKEFREPRLMTKFDHASSLPVLFKDYDLSILPITRGSYVIGHFKNYHQLDLFAPKEIVQVTAPAHIESIDFNDIYSESTALNCAYVSGIIDDFLEAESLPTVSGRMSSSTFEFNIESKNYNKIGINVQNSQCEIDGGYETLDSLALIEAKNHLADDFLIRQVYYPYRLWEGKIGKPIRNIYMAYSNDIFHFYEYSFSTPEDYNSLALVKYKAYQISPEEIEIADLTKVLKNTKIQVNRSGAPFPQADKFTRIIDLFGLLKSNSDLTKEEITSKYGFDVRQTDYYINALIFLNLAIRSEKSTYCLTELGEKVSMMAHKQKTLKIVGLVLQNEVFHKALELYLSDFEPITKGEVIEIMSKSKSIGDNSKTTIYRRSQTVLKRIEWVLDQIV